MNLETHWAIHGISGIRLQISHQADREQLVKVIIKDTCS